MSINYDPKKVSVVVNGTFITGFADGTFIGFEKTTDDVTPHEGADGQVDYSENPSNSAMYTLTIKHTSPSNRYLEGLRTSRADIAITIRDANENGETNSGVEGRIMRTPNREYGKEITNREWSILVPNFNITA